MFFVCEILVKIWYYFYIIYFKIYLRELQNRLTQHLQSSYEVLLLFNLVSEPVDFENSIKILTHWQ